MADCQCAIIGSCILFTSRPVSLEGCVDSNGSYGDSDGDGGGCGGNGDGKGTGQATKTVEFSEKIQTGFDPPSFWKKNSIAFFPNKPYLKPCAIVQNLRYKFLD